jgi:hypothetical protein
MPPDSETFKQSVEQHCQKFQYAGYTFYLHQISRCGCHCCTKTRQHLATLLEVKDPTPSVVTWHNWKHDIHWYRTLGPRSTKEQAAELLLMQLKRDGGKELLRS